ncbi:alcohol dehydrogenase [Aaosphaeria arxii CBS 175.79]|uniref:Alcohol dehydrogenase n=1 Tax=Aaosphaeria arxii CBS 175.79 TaxID=1450172 RepID=A0A6A5XGE4_9PLEO|nr:alcohol dehydrogenase [Aaosphaeria arxii CBS 175.79]KAF2011990.1 alcohol dehydrogenase [Aaosphaeria arxii CBS 175.79]
MDKSFFRTFYTSLPIRTHEYAFIQGSPEGVISSTEVSRALADREVFIETTQPGLCGPDEHYMKSGQVLGHEGIGIIQSVGAAVTLPKQGDRVGFGYTHEIYGTCDNCSTDKPYVNYSGAVWDPKCVYRIPEGYASEYAAPLMVAITGIGGLGHLAIKLAAVMGCQVVVLSSSKSKRRENLEYGATEFHCFRFGDTRAKTFEPVKHLLLCGSTVVNYASLIPLMDTYGSIYPLTVAFEPAPVPMLDLVWKGVRIQGSLVASRQTIKDLLEFAARKDIKPTIVTYPLTIEGISTAMKALRNGAVRYRAVLLSRA